MAVIKNIGTIKSIIFNGNLKGKGIELSPHIRQLSSVLPIHRSALEALKNPSIASFLADKNIKELRKIRDWENIHLSLAKPFLDLNVEAKAIKIINHKGNEVAIWVLADKNVEIAGDKVRIIFKGNEFDLTLKEYKGILKEIKDMISPAIISPPMTPPEPEFKIKGRPASYYIGIGRAFIPTRPDISKFASTDITDEMVDKEMEEADKAFKEIIDKYRNVPGNGEGKQAADTVAGLLEAVCQASVKLIEEKKYNFKKALEATLKPIIDGNAASKDEKFRSFGQELQMTFDSLILARHNQLVDLLADVESVSNLHSGEKVVPICVKIDFLEAASFEKDKSKIAALVEEKGGINSHTTLASKACEIPLVIGVEKATEKIKNGQLVIVDGERGAIIVNPTKETLNKFMAIKEGSEKERAELRKRYKDKPAKTLDGVEISLLGNSKSIAEIERLLHEGIKKGGLLRTEESMDIDLVSGTITKRTKAPSLNEQVDFYSRIFRALGEGAHVVIRTMDVNGDKYITYLGEPQKDIFGQTKEGIGLCIDQENHRPYYDLFKDQIKAILIAAKKEKVEPIIEFPMVLSVKQFKEAKKVVEKVMKEMKEDKISFETKVKYYAMVEHPFLMRAINNKLNASDKDSAVIENELEVDGLARVVDGLSLGTNDLTMKTLFEDRYSARTKFNELHPDVLASIAKTIRAAKNAGKPLMVCGDMASDPIAGPVLIGLGIRELSVDASSPNIIKSLISNIDVKTCEKLVSELKEIKTAEEARRFVAEFVMTRMNHGDKEHGDWSGLKELESVLRKYIYFADGTQYQSEKEKQ